MDKHMIYCISTIIFISAICIIAAHNVMQSNAAERVEYRYAKEDVELTVRASKTSLTEVVVKKGTKVKYIETVIKKDGTTFERVEITADDVYEKDYVGYIVSEKLTDEVVAQDDTALVSQAKLDSQTVVN